MVGPNGSGKSNVIDAMLFVFGKRAKQVISNYCHLVIYFVCLAYSLVVANLMNCDLVCDCSVLLIRVIL